MAGCADPTAANYASDANAPAPCEYPVLGCMLEGAPNYDASATRDDGSCVYVELPPPPPSPDPPPPPPQTTAPLPASSSPTAAPPPPAVRPSDAAFVAVAVAGLLAVVVGGAYELRRRRRKARSVYETLLCDNDPPQDPAVLTVRVRQSGRVVVHV